MLITLVIKRLICCYIKVDTLGFLSGHIMLTIDRSEMWTSDVRCKIRNSSSAKSASFLTSCSRLNKSEYAMFLQRPTHKDQVISAVTKNPERKLVPAKSADGFCDPTAEQQ